MWFSVSIGSIGIYSADKDQDDPPIVFFKKLHLVEASNVLSAYEKAKRIVSYEAKIGRGELDGKPAILRPLGILCIDLVIDELKSGAEVFDERVDGCTLSSVTRELFSDADLQRLVEYEKTEGFPPPCKVDYGSDFDYL